MNKIEKLLKNNYFVFLIYRFIFNCVFKFIGIFLRVDKNLYLFNGLGFKYNDSPRFIYEQMLEDPRFKNSKFVWAVDNPELYSIPNSKVIKMNTFEYFVTALKAKYWISCMNIERGLTFKKKKTIYLNTWHGIPIKAIGNSAKGRKDFNFKNVNYFCVSGEHEIDIYIKSLGLKEDQLFKVGTPIQDELFNISDKETIKLKEQFSLPLNKKIILYAPTFRDNKTDDNSYLLDIDKIYDQFGDDIVIIFRGHHFTATKLNNKYKNKVFDYSNHWNPNDILKVSDILITDYSSIVFNFAILEKPFILYVEDIKQYESERGLSLNIFNVFSSEDIAVNIDDLIAKITNKINQKTSKSSKKIKERFTAFSGDATNSCIDVLYNK